MEIKCLIGVGPIRFGMSPDEVRVTLGAEFESFKRTPASDYLCDHFHELGCFVYYDGERLVEAVELAEPAKPTLDGINLLSASFKNVIENIKRIDPDVSAESDGFTSLRLGLGGWAPSAEDEPDDALKSIVVFSEGYYD